MSKKVKVVMTRTNDTFIELSERARISNNAGARIFVSIHMNAFNGSARGVETFLHNASSASLSFAQKANDALLEQFNVPNRGVKRANFAVLRGTYKNSLSILTETLFMDNSQDAALFKRSDFVEKAAQAHVKAILSVANEGDTVCLDPGHGGHDNGATGNGKREKDLVLKIALRTRDILEGKVDKTSSGTSFTNFSNAQKYDEISKAVESVRHLQNLLIGAGFPLPKYGADNKPGSETLSAIQNFQREYNISSPSGDFYGRPGAETIKKLRSIVEYGGVRRVSRTGYTKGNDVRAIQRVLGVNDDSIYGPVTANAVKRYQTTNGLISDAVVGPQTWSHMFG